HRTTATGGDCYPRRRTPGRNRVGRYFGRKALIYALTFVVAVTLNWLIPRFMPGDPVLRMLPRTSVSNPDAIAPMRAYYENVFGLDVPMWQQYLNYWGELFHGN